MNSQSTALRVASFIFALVSIAHLIRFLTRAEVLIAGWSMPFWLNIVGILVAGFLSLWMWRLANRT